MKINRRNLLWATAALAMTGLVGPTSSQANLAGSDEFPWHPFTGSLLDRARQASLVDGRTNRALIERLIHLEGVTQGYAEPPVIKWLADPFEAFEYLSRLGLDELLQVDATRLWRRAGPQVSTDDDRLDSAAVLGSRIAGLVRSAEYDNALMAPKLLSKARVMAQNASAEAVFKVRAVAAQIGWLETCIPLVKPSPTSNSFCPRVPPRSRYIISCGPSKSTSLACSRHGRRRKPSSASSDIRDQLILREEGEA